MAPDTGAAPSACTPPRVSSFLVAALALMPVALAGVHGGYFPTTWMAAGMLVTASAIALRVTAGPSFPGFRSGPPARSIVPLVLLGLFAAWTLVYFLLVSNRPRSLSW